MVTLKAPVSVVSLGVAMVLLVPIDAYAPPIGRPAPRQSRQFEPTKPFEPIRQEPRLDDFLKSLEDESPRISEPRPNNNLLRVPNTELSDRQTKDFAAFKKDANSELDAANARFLLGLSSDGTKAFLAATHTRFDLETELDYLVLDLTTSGKWSLPDMAISSVKIPNAPERITASARLTILHHDLLVLTEEGLSSIIVHEQVLDRNATPKEITARGEVRVVSAKPPPAQYTAKSFTLGKPPPKWYARTKGCCLYSARPPQHESIRRIEQKAFSRDHLRIVNFFEDSLTESKLQELKSTGLQVSATNPRDLGHDHSSRLKGIFSAARGGVVTIVGHVEGKDTFVAQDAEGKELLRLKVQELLDLADQADVSLILLGCFTGDSVSANNPNFVGTLTKIRSIDAVERIDRAAGKASNWAQFLELLGDEGMPLIMSKDFLTTDQEYRLHKRRSCDTWPKSEQRRD